MSGFVTFSPRMTDDHRSHPVQRMEARIQRAESTLIRSHALLQMAHETLNQASRELEQARALSRESRILLDAYGDRGYDRQHGERGIPGDP